MRGQNSQIIKYYRDCHKLFGKVYTKGDSHMSYHFTTTTNNVTILLLLLTIIITNFMLSHQYK